MRKNSSYAILILCAAALLGDLMPVFAQPVPVASQPVSFQQAIANAKKERWERWLALRKTLLEERQMLLDNVKEKYYADVKTATTTDQAKALRAQAVVDSKKIVAAVQEELDKTLIAVNDAFYYNVEQICKQYEEPLPRWVARYKTR